MTYIPIVTIHSQDCKLQSLVLGNFNTMKLALTALITHLIQNNHISFDSYICGDADYYMDNYPFLDRDIETVDQFIDDLCKKVDSLENLGKCSDLFDSWYNEEWNYKIYELN
jgi:hypothetical protein